jgi:hypothetical protein
VSLQKIAGILSVSLGLSFINPVAATEGTVAIRSIGAQSCGDAVKVLTKKESNETVPIIYTQWLSGFVSAYNIDHKIFDAFPIRTPADELLKYVISLCLVNSKVNFVSVVVAGLKAAEPFQTTTLSDVTAIEVEGRKIEFYKEYIKLAQLHLRESGQGVIVDGLYGASSEAAFRKYKEDNNLSGPPVPDHVFLLSMIEKKK